MKIDGTIVNLVFNNISILEGANTFLCSEFQLSKDDGISFLCYLTQRSDVSKDALSKLLKEWRATKTETSFAEEVDLNTNNVNSLLPLFGIQEKYERNDEAVHSYDIDPHSYDVDPLEEGRAFKEQSLFACKQAAA